MLNTKMAFTRLPVFARKIAWKCATTAYGTNPGKEKKDKAIENATLMVKPAVAAACKAKGMNSLMTFIIMTVAVKLVIALILYYIEKNWSGPKALSSLFSYPEDAPGFSKDLLSK